MMSFCIISPVAIPSHSPCFWNHSPHLELKESSLWFSKDCFANPSSFKNHVCRFSFLLLSNVLVLYHCDQSPICRVGLGNPFPPCSPVSLPGLLGKTREMAFRFTVLAVSCNSLLFVLSDVQGKTNSYTNIIKGQDVPQWACHRNKHLGSLLSPDVSTLEEGGFYHYANWPVLGGKYIANLRFQNMWMVVSCKGFCIPGNTKWGKERFCDTVS